MPLSAHAELGCAPGTGADLASLVDQIATLPEGGWLRVNENRYDEVWTPPDLRPSSGALLSTPSKIIQAWSSFAWDCRRGDVLLYGGGHANYSGNDTYRWRASTRRWERMSLPSDIRVDEMGNTTAIDGPFAAPPAAHTYDNNIYLPYIDRFLVLGGSAWNNGGAFEMATGPDSERITGPYTFDLDMADGAKVGGTTGSHVKASGPRPEIVGGMMWQNRDLYALFPLNSLPSNHTSGTTSYAGTGSGDIVLYTARQGLGTAQHLFRYELTDPDDAATDKVTRIGRFVTGVTGRGAGAFDPDLNVYVRTAIGSTKAIFFYWDLAKASTTNPNVIFTPFDASGQWTMDRGYGMDFDPVRGQYLLWGGTGDVWVMRAPATVSSSGWTIDRMPSPTSADAPVSDYDGVSLQSGGGVLGKWKYVPELDAFVGLEGTESGNVWIYKPVGWVRPGTEKKPTLNLTLTPDRAFSGDDVTIAWRTTGASSCTADGGWAGAKPTKGSQNVAAELASSMFGLRCDGPGGTTYRSVALTVDPIGPPTIGDIGVDSCVNAAEVAAGVSIRGTGKPGATITVTLAALSRTATVDPHGIWQAAFSSSQLVSLPEGSLTVGAKQTIDGVNYSPTATTNVTKDSVAPTATSSIPSLLASSDTGSSSNDGLTRDTTPTYTGQASAPSVPVTLLIDSMAAVMVKASTTGKWTATSKALASGPHLVSAAVTDTCGNAGPISATATLTIDRAKPSLTVSAIAGDNRLNAVEIQETTFVQGIAETQVAISLTISSGTTALLKRSSDSNGTWSLALSAAETAALPDGNLTFGVVATDAAGNTAIVKRTVNKDTEIATPTLSPVSGDDVLTSSERSSGISVAGQGEPKATVTVTVNGWTRQKAVATDGSWSLDVPSSTLSSLPLGNVQFSVQARDPAGNLSATASRVVQVTSSK